MKSATTSQFWEPYYALPEAVQRRNASPLISLARIDQFNLLKSLFQNIVAPEAVWREVVVQGTGKPAADLAIHAEQ